ncbi:hypothetical protein KX729_29385 [Rhizobium sp. XQZ8]|uniref:hypothetical protein n=1 Tax=Rhizobium populisoli TaxID=2859785 RepID=UPI001CA58DED|nr:hypothetical protein [Rhizobium populisoli]MBW6425530.1 hypothetical protein [Rhizobium populisoli]
MPGTFVTVYLLAFDLDGHGQAVKAFEARPVASEVAAIEAARALADSHAGVVVWKREGDPVVGEEGDPEIVFQSGRIGDFG